MSSIAGYNRPAVIGIDYGHGGMIDGEYQNPKSKQYTFTDHNNRLICEGMVNRQIAAKVMSLIIQRTDHIVVDCVKGEMVQVTPHWFTDLDQRNATLAERVRNANSQHLDLFISMHSNAIGNELSGPSLPARGVSFFTSPGQTHADTFVPYFYEEFADAQALPIRKGDWKDGDVDWEAGFFVLTRTRAPAILGEVGFFTNYDDAKYLQSGQGQDAIAEAYFRAIVRSVRWLY